MVNTPSTMLPLGTPAPDFALPDVLTGEVVTKSSIAEGKPLLMMFICAHCPFVIHLQDELAEIGRDCAGKDLAIVAVSANSIKTHPQDGPDALARQAKEVGFPFPYLYDETQEMTKAYTAACTPDFFLFDSRHHLVYRGQLDDSRPGSDLPVTGYDLREAIGAVLEGTFPSANQKSSMGCNIKWHPGQAPAYFG